MELSSTANCLSNECKARYLEKINLLFGDNPTDPYLIEKEVFYSVLESKAASLPNLAYPDIYYYLVHNISAYTDEELKAYKSLEAYNFFMAGWITNLKCMKTSKNFILTSQVGSHKMSVCDD